MSSTLIDRVYSGVRSVALVIVLGALSACGPFRHGSGPQTAVVFENRSVDQVDVFVVNSAGNRARLGTVSPGSTQSLRVPPAAIGASGSVSVVARVFASNRTPSTGQITMLPGDVVRVTLPPEGNILTILPGRL